MQCFSHQPYLSHASAAGTQFFVAVSQRNYHVPIIDDAFDGVRSIHVPNDTYFILCGVGTLLVLSDTLQRMSGTSC